MKELIEKLDEINILNDDDNLWVWIQHHHEAWVLEPPWGRDLRKAWSRLWARDLGTAVGPGVKSLESPWGQGCGEIDPKFKPEE